MARARKPKPETRAAMIGRPTVRTDAVIDHICEQLANGKSMTSILKAEDMPAFSSVWLWEKGDAELSKRFASAREAGRAYLAEEVIDIADDEEKDPTSRRIRIETRLRLLGIWNKTDLKATVAPDDGLAKLMGEIAAQGRPKPGA